MLAIFVPGGSINVFTVLDYDIEHSLLSGTDIAAGEEVAIKLECVKTKHPQLHIESKIYKMMQGGGKIMLINHVSVNGPIVVVGNQDISAIFSVSLIYCYPVYMWVHEAEIIESDVVNLWPEHAAQC